MRYCRYLFILATALTGLGLAAASAAARPIDWLAPLWLLAPTMAPRYTVTRLPPGVAFLNSSNRCLNALGQVAGTFSNLYGTSQSGAFLWDNGRLTVLGDENSEARFINDAGQVAGVQWIQGRVAARAFLWENGVMHNLGLLDTGTSEPKGLNNAGQVVGNWDPENSRGRLTRGFLWEKGVTRDLGTLVGASSGASAIAINEAGQVVGGARLSGPGPHAFLWQHGTIIDLGTVGPLAISNSGLVAGALRTRPRADYPWHPFLWENGVMHDLGLLGGESSFATDVNDAGQVIGTSQPASRAGRAFLWEKGVMTDLGTFGGKGSYATKINNAGQVVGIADTTQVPSNRNPLIHAFLWEKGALIDLNNVLPDGADLGNSEAESINDRGQILVDAFNSRKKETEVYLLTPTW